METSEPLHAGGPDAEARGGLADWTGTDDPMRWVGEALGLFDDAGATVDSVLSHDNRLRRALFDVLLNLVEGGVADMRGTEGGYEFKARTDDEVAWLAPAGPTIDLTAPAPLSEELRQACQERDEALRRAAVAEALAAERERLLMRFAATTEIHVVRHSVAEEAEETEPANDDPGETDAASPPPPAERLEPDRETTESKAPAASTDSAPTEPIAASAPKPAETVEAPARRWPWIVASVVLFVVAVFAAIIGSAYLAGRSGPAGMPDATSSARQHLAAAVAFAVGVVALAAMGWALRSIGRRRADRSVVYS